MFANFQHNLPETAEEELNEIAAEVKAKNPKHFSEWQKNSPQLTKSFDHIDVQRILKA